MDLNLLPESLAATRITCKKCGLAFMPDFFRQLPEPWVPVKPTSTLPEDPGRWIPTGLNHQCPKCKEFTTHTLPVFKLKGRINLYGDEAFRDLDGKAIATYSLVGADTRILSVQIDKLNRVKAELETTREPDTWSFHMTELWSSQKRKKHPVFSSWTDDKCRRAYDLLFSIFTVGDPLHVYNIVARGPQSRLKQLKHEAYAALLAFTIDDLTSIAAQPNIYFDAERPSEGDYIIQGWARDLLRHSRHSALYPYLARGIEIPEPIFVKPASHPCLELADFVSYVVARYYYNRWKFRTPELDPERLGVVRYIGFDNRGDLVFQSSKGYPWDLLHSSK